VNLLFNYSTILPQCLPWKWRERGVLEKEGTCSIFALHRDVLVGRENDEGHGAGYHEKSNQFSQVDQEPCVANRVVDAAAAHASAADDALYAPCNRANGGSVNSHDTLSG